jgi:hypothetical protein
MYDARDLIDMIRIDPQAGPAATRPSPDVSRDRAGALPNHLTFEEAAEELVRLIEDTVEVDSWKDNGGSAGAIRELSGRLVITQTPAAHRQIIKLLRTLRAGISKEGTDLSGNAARP